jgi:hypothetical protein
MWTRLEPMVPFLDVEAHRVARTDGYEVWDVAVTARGGETIEEVTIEPVSGPAHIVGGRMYQGLRSGLTRPFRVQLDGNGNRAVVRIEQKGAYPATKDVPLGGVP